MPRANPSLTKSEVLDLFGGTKREAAELLGITRQAIDQWPDAGPVTEAVENRVIGTLIRLAGGPIGWKEGFLSFGEFVRTRRLELKRQRQLDAELAERAARAERLQRAAARRTSSQGAQ